MDKIGKPVYAIIDSSLFGMRIVSGMVTGVNFTENEPIYTIRFGKDTWTSKVIAESDTELLSLLKLPPLKRISETHGLLIKYGN